jgi:hypothetical protein
MDTTRLTTYWTADEAATIITFLDILRDALWETYGEQIATMLRDDYNDRIQDTNQYESEFNDDIPF